MWPSSNTAEITDPIVYVLPITGRPSTRTKIAFDIIIYVVPYIAAWNRVRNCVVDGVIGIQFCHLAVYILNCAIDKYEWAIWVWLDFPLNLNYIITRYLGVCGDLGIESLVGICSYNHIQKPRGLYIPREQRGRGIL